MVKKIENENISETKNVEVAVVDFSATWCGPCKMLAPVLEELSEEMSERINFYNVDVDENPELASEYEITNIPAILLLKNGKEVARNIGFQPKEALCSFIEKNQ